jgi:hypothetical protein
LRPNPPKTLKKEPSMPPIRTRRRCSVATEPLKLRSMWASAHGMGIATPPAAAARSGAAAPPPASAVSPSELLRALDVREIAPSEDASRCPSRSLQTDRQTDSVAQGISTVGALGRAGGRVGSGSSKPIRLGAQADREIAVFT